MYKRDAALWLRPCKRLGAGLKRQVRLDPTAHPSSIPLGKLVGMIGSDDWPPSATMGAELLSARYFWHQLAKTCLKTGTQLAIYLLTAARVDVCIL